VSIRGGSADSNGTSFISSPPSQQSVPPQRQGPPPPVETQSNPGPGKGSLSSSELANIRKIENFDPTFHHFLEKRFPDWDKRMDYQEKQFEIYESAQAKKRESERTRSEKGWKFTDYTAEEQNAIHYMNGTGRFAKYRDPKTKPNIYDTRQSFLLNKSFSHLSIHLIINK